VSRAGSAGRPALNVETRLVDDDEEDVGPGEIGEIVHRSPQATLGYWNDEAKTAEAFRGGWFHSGDLGRLDADGYLFIVDRKKDMVKTGGENVASSEVEETIYLMSEVSEVAVFGVADPRWIEAVVAAVVPKPSASLTPEAVIAHCRSRLAASRHRGTSSWSTACRRTRAASCSSGICASATPMADADRALAAAQAVPARRAAVRTRRPGVELAPWTRRGGVEPRNQIRSPAASRRWMRARV
jgi:acyl-CoA synthetase (AMP-forming)/AMP-acid ligase II